MRIAVRSASPATHSEGAACLDGLDVLKDGLFDGDAPDEQSVSKNVPLQVRRTAPTHLTSRHSP